MSFGRLAPRNVGVVVVILEVSGTNASRDGALEVEGLVRQEDAGWCRHRAFRGRRRGRLRVQAAALEAGAEGARAFFVASGLL